MESQVIDKDKGFHYKDGIYFKRLKDGSIHIQKYALHHTGTYQEFSIIVDFDSWVSIIYSLTKEKGDYKELEERLRLKE